MTTLNLAAARVILLNLAAARVHVALNLAALNPGVYVGASITVKLTTNASIIRVRVRVHMPPANIKNILEGISQLH
jgi:hypothetical protein